MKLMLIIAMLGAFYACAHAQSGSITLLIEGIDIKKGGALSAGIFQRGNFPKVGQQLMGKEIRVQGTSMQITFTQVPPGAYGVAVFQDTDLNGALKTNIVGLPLEPIGFSNDARIRFGPPSFDDAKFIVERNKDITMKIILR